MSEELSPERQAIRDRCEELRLRENEARKTLEHVRVDWKHIRIDCPHPARKNYTVMGDPTSTCADCGHLFY